MLTLSVLPAQCGQICNKPAKTINTLTRGLVTWDPALDTFLQLSKNI